MGEEKERLQHSIESHRDAVLCKLEGLPRDLFGLRQSRRLRALSEACAEPDIRPSSYRSMGHLRGAIAAAEVLLTLRSRDSLEVIRVAAGPGKGEGRHPRV